MNRRRFLGRAAGSAAAFGVLRELGACSPAAPAAVAPNAGSADGAATGAFRQLRDQYFVDTLRRYPVVSTYLGGDGYSPALAGVNGTLRDFRPEALADEIAFLKGIDRARQRIDAAALAPADRIDHGVLGAQVAFVLHQLDERHYPERAVDTYVAEPFRGVDWQLQQMQDLAGGARGTADEWELVGRRLRTVPAYLDAARARLLAGRRAGNLPDRRLIAEDGVAGSQANVDYFRSTLPRTAAGYLGKSAAASRTLERLTEAGAAAAAAFDAFARFLRESFPDDGTADRFAAGEQEYDWRLANCLRVDRRAADLWEYGAAQVALYEDRISRVAAEVARDAGLSVSFGNPNERRAAVRQVMQHLSEDSPRDDDELFRWYREAGKRAVAYGREQQLFDIPADYRLDVVPTPPVLRSTIDAAYYPAPPFKHSGVGRFYLTPTGNDPGALRVNNRASVADTAVHEGFPGHDWHYKYMTQHAAEISNIRWLTPGAVEDSSSMWEDSMAAEGWALYSEELMAEPARGRPHGFYTAAEHLYELQGQLLRAVRVRVDVGMHTGRMSFDDAVDYFTEHVSFYPGACAAAGRDDTAHAICATARRAIYRYSKWPTQAVTYNLGKSAIAALRGALSARAGRGFSARAFHERLMRMGTIPAGYFREEMLANPV
ncbi:MAG TPA: DUF885 domain-containing protein [Gemmatimonadales bacterium]|nr:DUF885 domain-containing protein [Gemmatimonadales bacterium]